jgi:beta-galactosidase/beta-glucuronidase
MDCGLKLLKINYLKIYMKKVIVVVAALICLLAAQAQWKPAGDKIKTKWAENIDISRVLPEYPRPLMVRQNWSNLNGLWSYAIRPMGEVCPIKFDGNILVPFAVESSLSGVQKGLTDNEELWYSRVFKIPANWKGQKVLLHFGAVDWKADIWVNDVKIGQHTGGFAAFTFDITAALISGENKLIVKAWDPTSNGEQPRGKQAYNPSGIFYTPVSGIWQTVWLEPVAEHYIVNVKTTPDIDKSQIKIEIETDKLFTGDIFEVKLYDGSTLAATGKALGGQIVELNLKNQKLWSPENPFLYDMQVSLIRNGKAIDNIQSYAAMRKFSSHRDENGHMRMQLNNKDYFQLGPLDQGWWPDGLFTAPSDEALKYDIQKTKDFGFNMIRKHVKVEPARWYAHCDKLGIIVWQDMPSGGKGPEWIPGHYFDGIEMQRTPESEANFRKELKEIIDANYSYTCIGVWTIFNESWGQFKTPEMVKWAKDYDPTRLINPASGGNHYICGDMLDLHHYPGPNMFLRDPQRVNVLGEFGGIGLAIKDHLWDANRNWGYVKLNSVDEATDEYVKYAEQLFPFIEKGLSAGVYTQTTDVEEEINGLITYDRKVIKMNEPKVRAINQKICNSLNK